MGSVAKTTSLPVYPVSVSFLSRHFPVGLLTVPGSDPSLTSDPVPSPAAVRPACRRGAASSPAAAVAARSTACVVAGATVGATRTPPTGATVAAHPGTQSSARAAAAGVTGRWINATKPGTRHRANINGLDPQLCFQLRAETVDVGVMDWVRFDARLKASRQGVLAAVVFVTRLRDRWRLNVFLFLYCSKWLKCIRLIHTIEMVHKHT